MFGADKGLQAIIKRMLADINALKGKGIIDIIEGDNISIDKKNPRKPKISSTGSGSKIDSIVEGTNITVDDTDPLNPIISASSSLFPNGAKLVETDRAVQADDAGYALLLSDGVQLTIPTICPLSPGQYFGITTNSATASFIPEGASSEFSVYLSYAGQEAALINEVVTYVAADVGGSTSLILLTQIAGSNDTIMTANRYFFEQSQNAIPLSGTEVGKPVTGDIDFANANIIFNNIDGDKFIKFGFNTATDETGLYFDNGLDPQTRFSIYNGDIQCYMPIGSYFSFANDYLGFSNNGNSSFVGIRGGEDYSNIITDLDYTQKIYVGFRGTATLSSGTVTVTTDKIKTGYKIYLSVNTPSGTQGFLSAPTGSIVNEISFVINSSSVLDNSTVNWWIAP